MFELISFNRSKHSNSSLPSLPRECLFPIISHLSNDKGTLHSCLFVCRFWFQEAARVLWSQPFKLLYTCKKKQCNCSSEKRRYQSANLLLVYLACLMHQYKDDFLKEEPTSELPPPPLLNYIEYLQNVDLNELYSSIEDWMKTSYNLTRYRKPKIIKFIKKRIYRNIFVDRDLIDYTIFIRFLAKFTFKNEISLRYQEYFYDNSCRDLLVHNIIKTFMTQCPKLVQISIEQRHLYTRKPNEYFCSSLRKERSLRLDYCNLPTGDYESLSNYSIAVPCLHQLTELICTTKRRKASLLLSLSQFSHNIEFMAITISYQRDLFGGDVVRIYEQQKVENEAYCLATLIESQKRLRSLRLHVCSEGLSTIMVALKTQINSLNSLSFVSVKFFGYEILSYLMSLKKLQRLEFISSSFKDEPDEMVPSILTNLSFSYLTELNFNGSYITNEILGTFLKISYPNLETLIIGKQNLRNGSQSFITGSRKIISRIPTLYPELKHLKLYLTLDEIPQLIPIFSCNKLETITLAGYTQKSGQEIFLNESKFKKLDSFEIVDSKNFGNEHLEVIIKCLKDVIKKLVLRTKNRLSRRLIKKAGKFFDINYQRGPPRSNSMYGHKF
ncbi:14905_t:CDS:2 [Cetraspora pellucida]|uniref:14905_t:CDS:1 n=1 Tax=Cetraspora pellucida TaxID=1433469 RepID=A0A9N8ZTG5_9GLOM|nr:14905_t:CDS:2 [Cetraspora pellucida]